MPRKNPDEYREYMKNYMRKKYYEKEPSVEKVNATVEKLTDIEKGTKSVTDKARILSDLAKEFGNKESEGMQSIDKIDKWINLAEKYAPLILQAVKGFADRNAELQTQQANIKDVNVGTPAPTGWVSMSPMERLSRKYEADGSISNWYTQGEMYENESSYKPPQLQQPQQQAQVQQKPQSLEELAKQYPEPPLIKDSEPVKEQPKQEEVKKVNNMQENINNETKALIEQLRQDNEQYLIMAFDYVNKMDNEQLKKHIEDKTLLELLDKYKMLIPTQTKQMLITIDDPYLINLLKLKCKDKYDFVEKEKLLDNVKELFKELQEKLK